jgi:hypothetical protein
MASAEFNAAILTDEGFKIFQRNISGVFSDFLLFFPLLAQIINLDLIVAQMILFVNSQKTTQPPC